jgi:hypothetical protein
VAPRDQPVALQHLEGLAQGHQRHAVLLGEPALIVEPRAGDERAAGHALAETLRDLVIPGHPARHATAS